MARVNPVRFADLSGAVQTITTENLRAPNQVLHCLNGDFDRKVGGVIGRKGTNMISGGAIGAYTIKNLFVYRYLTTKTYIAVLDNGANMKVYKSSADNFAGSWTEVASLTTGNELFFENFIGKAIYFNGVDTPKYTTDFSTYTTLTNAPTAGKFPFVLGQRLFVVTEGGILHYSDVVDSTGLALSTTTWLNRGINPNDGQKVTYALRYRGRGVIFKEESMYNYDGNNEPEAFITVGTYSWRSVVIGTDGKLYFHHPSGFYEYTTGLPTPISRPIQKYIDGMTSANWSNVSHMKDSKCIYWWIGDVTINDPLEFDYGKVYTDVCLVWNVFSQRWTVYTNINARQGYFDGSTGKTYFGNSTGKIFEMGVDYVDKDGSTENPIHFELIPYPFNYGLPYKEKSFKSMYVCGRLQGEVMAAKSYSELFGRSSVTANMIDGIASLLREVNGKELWLAFNESYKDTPPYVKEIIYDDVEILESNI